MGLTAAEAFDALGKDYEAAYEGMPGRGEELDWLLAELPAGARVLDLGCGTGRPVAELLAAAGHDVTGVDVSPRMVEIASAQVPAGRFEVADLRDLTYPDGSFHAVVALFSLLQISRAEIDAALADIAGWLKPGGVFLLATVPADAEGLEIEFLGQPVTVTSYPTEVFQDRLAGLGLNVVRERIVEFDHMTSGPERDLFMAARKA